MGEEASLVQLPGVPATWGLLVSNGAKLTIKKQPMHNAEALPPSHTFLGAILRKVCTTLTEQVLLDQAFARGEEKGYREGVNVEIKRSDDGRLKKAHDDLVASVRAFEEASGVSISAGWNRGKIAKAVGLLTGGWDSIAGFTEISNQAARLAERCAEAAEEVRKTHPPIKDDPA